MMLIGSKSFTGSYGVFLIAGRIAICGSAAMNNV